MDSKPEGKGTVASSASEIDDRLEQFLFGKLHRYECPPLDQLRDYQLALLPAAVATPIAAHLANCPRCTEELATLATFLQPETVTESTATLTNPNLLAQMQEALAEARVIIANLVTPLSLATAAVGLRGSADNDPVSLLYEAGSDAINLLIETTVDPATASPTVTVAGQLFTAQSFAPGESVAMLTPVDTTRPPVHREIDSTGNFTFQQLAPGDYQLRVKTVDQQIVVPLVQV